MVTSGFFNSVEHDRKYDAEQISSMFDGLILDGTFATYGSSLVVKSENNGKGSGTIVYVGSGKAWFKHVWILNDSILPIDMGLSDVLNDRFDAVVIEVNHNESVRAGTIKVVKGQPDNPPVKPNLLNTEKVLQVPLCYIRRPAGNSDIDQSMIENCIGTPVNPFVTAMLQVISVDELCGQWTKQLNDFIANKTYIYQTFENQMRNRFESAQEDKENRYTAAEANRNQIFNTNETARETAYSATQAKINETQTRFDSWYDKSIADFNAAEAERTKAYNATKAKIDATEADFTSWVSTTQSDFNKAQLDRETAFTASEKARTDAFNLSETNRSDAFKASEANRNSTFTSSQTARDTAFNASETERTNAYNAAEESRNTEYTAAEANRTSSFDLKEKARTDAFNASEANRNSIFQASQATVDEAKTQATNAAASANSSKQLAEQTKVDFDTWFNKAVADNTAFLNQAKQDLQSERDVWNAWTVQAQADFDQWFTNIKENLTGEVASNLLKMIEDVQKQVEGKAQKALTFTATIPAEATDHGWASVGTNLGEANTTRRNVSVPGLVADGISFVSCNSSTVRYTNPQVETYSRFIKFEIQSGNMVVYAETKDPDGNTYPGTYPNTNVPVRIDVIF